MKNIKAKEEYEAYIQERNEHAKNYLRGGKLLGRTIDVENKDEVIAALYTIMAYREHQFLIKNKDLIKD